MKVDSILVYTPDLLHERNNVDEELFGELGFAADHETLKQAAAAPDELVEGALGQTHRVTHVHSTNIVHLALRHQRVQYLQVSARHFSIICLQSFDTVGWASGRASGPKVE